MEETRPLNDCGINLTTLAEKGHKIGCNSFNNHLDYNGNCKSRTICIEFTNTPLSFGWAAGVDRINSKRAAYFRGIQ